MKKAIFPGSFDPFTNGHKELIDRGLRLFDHIIIAFGNNSQKRGMYTLEERMDIANAVYKDDSRVSVECYEGLTTDFAKLKDINLLLRGLRNGIDLEYERPIALLNKHVYEKIETVFLIPSPQYAHISSTLVRELIKYGAPMAGLVPVEVIDYIKSIG